MFLTKDEYDELLGYREALASAEDDVMFLRALEQAGVDNWEGYSVARQLFEGEIDEDDI